MRYHSNNKSKQIMSTFASKMFYSLSIVYYNITIILWNNLDIWFLADSIWYMMVYQLILLRISRITFEFWNLNELNGTLQNSILVFTTQKNVLQDNLATVNHLVKRYTNTITNSVVSCYIIKIHAPPHKASRAYPNIGYFMKDFRNMGVV